MRFRIILQNHLPPYLHDLRIGRHCAVMVGTPLLNGRIKFAGCDAGLSSIGCGGGIRVDACLPKRRGEQCEGLLQIELSVRLGRIARDDPALRAFQIEQLWKRYFTDTVGQTQVFERLAVRVPQSAKIEIGIGVLFCGRRAGSPEAYGLQGVVDRCEDAGVAFLQLCRAVGSAFRQE